MKQNLSDIALAELLERMVYAARGVVTDGRLVQFQKLDQSGWQNGRFHNQLNGAN